MVMQFIEGISLHQRLASGHRMELPDITRVMRGVLSALVWIHQNDIIHRDVKPDNIILAAHGVFLVDLSIAYSTRQATGDARATVGGEHVGTANYAAPEQLRDSSCVDSRADIWSAGAVLGEMLGAKMRLRTETLDAEIGAVPDDLRGVVRRAAAESPGDRYQNGSDFLVALETVMQTALATGTGRGSPLDGEGDRVSDDEAVLLGSLIGLQGFSDDAVESWLLEKELKARMDGFAVGIARRRLVRRGFLEPSIKQDRNGDDIRLLSITESGGRWAEEHQARIAALIGPLSRPESTPPDDDIPF